MSVDGVAVKADGSAGAQFNAWYARLVGPFSIIHLCFATFSLSTILLLLSSCVGHYGC